MWSNDRFGIHPSSVRVAERTETVTQPPRCHTLVLYGPTAATLEKKTTTARLTVQVRLSTACRVTVHLRSHLLGKLARSDLNVNTSIFNWTSFYRVWSILSQEEVFNIHTAAYSNLICPPTVQCFWFWARPRPLTPVKGSVLGWRRVTQLRLPSGLRDTRQENALHELPAAWFLYRAYYPMYMTKR